MSRGSSRCTSRRTSSAESSWGRRRRLKIIRESAMISLAGERSVNIALANKLGSPQAVREIEGVPFLMIYKF